MMYNQQIPHQQLPPQRPQQMLQHGIIQQQQTPSQALSQSLGLNFKKGLGRNGRA